MTRNWLAALAAVFAVQAHAFDLMKCTSATHGTLWASFGAYWPSGAPEARMFPTEIVVFGKDYVAREVYLYDLERALSVPLRLGERFMALEFDTLTDGTPRHHALSLLQYDETLTNAFQGNWTITAADGSAHFDPVACTRD